MNDYDRAALEHFKAITRRLFRFGLMVIGGIYLASCAFHYVWRF